MYKDAFLTKHIINWVNKEIEVAKDLLIQEKDYNTIRELQARIHAYHSVLFIIDQIINNINDDLHEAQKIIPSTELTGSSV